MIKGKKVQSTAAFLLIASTVLLWWVVSSPDVLCAFQDNERAGFTIQKDLNLNLEDKTFKYEQHQFNDSSFYSTHEFTTNQNKTVWIRLPVNSTILGSSMKITGKILLEKKTPELGANHLGLFRKVAIGNVTSDRGREVAVTSTGDEYLYDLSLLNSTLDELWSIDIGAGQGYGVDIGDINPSEPGNEIVVSYEDGVKAYNGRGEEVWNYSSGSIRSVSIANITANPGKETIGGGSSLYLINSSGGEIDTRDLGNETRAVTSGYVITSNGVKEIVTGTRGEDDKVYVFNYTDSFNLVCETDKLDDDVSSVDVGDLTDEAGNEITVADTTGKVYVFNSSCDQKYSYSTANNAGNDIRIGELVNNSPGNEVIMASAGGSSYVFNSTLGLIDEFPADGAVRGLDIGDIVNTSGQNEKEFVSATMNQSLYIIDYDSYPTNLTLEIGNNITWDYLKGDGRLRSSKIINDSNSEISPAFQDFLDNQTGGGGLANIPATMILFTSDYRGRLNVTHLNITYEYNATSDIDHNSTIPFWSQTKNVPVNQPVVKRSVNISFSPPAVAINIEGISLNTSAETCGLRNTNYSSFSQDGQDYCNVSASNLVVNRSDGHEPIYLWHDQLPSAVPLKMNATEPGLTRETNNYGWHKQLNIWQETPGLPRTFYNVTANTTISGDHVVEDEYLKVNWSGSQLDITPSEVSQCQQDPNYHQIPFGDDTFYVCMEDTNDDGVADFFKWKQPHSTSDLVEYGVGGSRNYEPSLSQARASPEQAIWGSWFEFKVNVSDGDNDPVNVSLWIQLNQTGEWVEHGMKTVDTSSGTASAAFNLTSSKEWTGTNDYKFEYQDYGKDYVYHSQNYSNYSEGKQVTAFKHSVSLINLTGNNPQVNRTKSLTLEGTVKDLDLNETAGDNINTSFWITTDGSSWDDGHHIGYYTGMNGTESYLFEPDGNYSVGQQRWKMGVYNDAHYKNNDSSNLTLEVHGFVSVNASKPTPGELVFRNENKHLQAHLYDTYGQLVEVGGYTCNFSADGQLLNSSQTNGTGYCSYEWPPDCSWDRGGYTLNVTLGGDASDLYTIAGSSDDQLFKIGDKLELEIAHPASADSFHKNETLWLNTTVNDTCQRCFADDYNVDWELYWGDHLQLSLTKTANLERNNEPLVIKGSHLSDLGIDIGNWQVNETRVLAAGEEVDTDVRPWTNQSRTALNYSQVYLDNTTDIVFPIDLAAAASQNYTLVWNQSNPQPQNPLPFIANAGFESGQTDPWVCDSCKDLEAKKYCNCTVLEEGSEQQGSHSLYLRSDGGTSTSSYDLDRQASNAFLKVRYKPWGEYELGSHFKLTAGAQQCELTPEQGEISQGEAQWNTSLCNFTSDAINQISFSLEDMDDTNNLYDYSHAYIDFICIANASGHCLHLQSGAPLDRTLSYKTDLGSAHDKSWSIDNKTTLGVRRIGARATGNYYQSAFNWTDFYLYGWSQLPSINLTSDYCTYNGTDWICSFNASIGAECWVEDRESQAAIAGYPVVFNSASASLANNETDSQGRAVSWFQGPDAQDNYYFNCSIGDNSALYYNTTNEDTQQMRYLVRSGNTSAILRQNPRSETAWEVTRTDPHAFNLSLSLINTGDKFSLYAPNITYSHPSGIEMEAMTCSPLRPGETCSENISVNVTQVASVGAQNINVTAYWTNPKGTVDSITNTTSLLVQNNTDVNIMPERDLVVSAGFDGLLTNYTVEAFGNTKIEGVILSLTGANSSLLADWTQLTPNNFTTIEKAGSKPVTVNASLPIWVSPGNYSTQLVANATNSTCDPSSHCWDAAALNLTVKVPDWYINSTPSNLSKTIGVGEGNGTIGEITIFNNLEFAQLFNLTLQGDKDYLSLSNQTTWVNKDSHEVIDVLHERTESRYPTGNYSAQLTIRSLNETTPHELARNVTLDVVELTVDIIQPTASSPVGPLNASENISIAVNVTKPGELLNSSVGFSVAVGDSQASCPLLVSEYQELAESWYLKCNAPSIPGNPINNTLRVEATHENITSYGTEETSVIYYDLLPPQFSSVDADPVRKSANVPVIPIGTTITDNHEIDQVWLEVTTPSNDTVRLDEANYTRTEDYYNFSFSNPNNRLGDYEITVYANDTRNQTGVSRYGGLTGSRDGWFDIYKPVNMVGNLQDADGNNISAKFTFERAEDNFTIHEFATQVNNSQFNWTLHRRNYDLLVEVFNHSVIFNNFNANQSSLVNGTLQDSFSNSLQLDSYPTWESSEIAILPNKFQSALMGFVLESDLDSGSVNITLNYSRALEIGREHYDSFKNKNNLEVLVCSNWTFSNETCPGGLSNTAFIDVQPSNGRIDFNVTPSTAYIVAEGCYKDGELIDCSGYSSPKSPSSPSSPSSNDPTQPDKNESEELPFPFELESNIETARVFPGQSRSYWLMITNNLEENLTVNLSLLSPVRGWLYLQNESVYLEEKGSKTTGLSFEVPLGAKVDTYSNTLVAEARGRQRTLPWEIKVKERGEDALKLELELIDDSIYAEDPLQASVKLESVDTDSELDVNLTYLIKDSKNNTLKQIKDNVSFTKTFSQIEKIPLAEANLKAGDYKLVVWAEFGDQAVRAIGSFEVVPHFLASTAGQALLFLGVPIAILVLVIGMFRLKGYYEQWQEKKEEEERYLFPVDDSKVPQNDEDAFWLGNIADANQKAYYDPRDLKTHTLVAGATGSGKSVAASVFAEEALGRDIPVVVFDPTAQFTGFVKRCQDDFMLKRYRLVGMDKDKRKSYPGLIYEMDNPEREIDFKSLMNPGEITVFTLNNLSDEEFDKAVRNIIDSMFEVNWEESEDLELVVVFDEVHRLLEAYGGEGGYEALERAAREFRKWGIGLVMISQVLKDFKDAIAGNVLTDVQLNTKAMEDIGKASDKYGEKYANRVTKQDIGVGMVQHPQYNEGNPWFVRFRPTWHNPHKLEEEELEKYKKFSRQLDEMEEKIEEMKEEGKDTFDVESSLRQAKDKLKSGNFRMTKIYLDTLKDKLGD